jgi:hypothetical protein
VAVVSGSTLIRIFQSHRGPFDKLPASPQTTGATQGKQGRHREHRGIKQVRYRWVRFIFVGGCVYRPSVALLVLSIGLRLHLKRRLTFDASPLRRSGYEGRTDTNCETATGQRNPPKILINSNHIRHRFHLRRTVDILSPLN